MSRRRVLLVEDEPPLARGLSDTLQARGFDVTVAADGERGLEEALADRADLILLDVMLPKINGFEICRAVRARGLDVPILMLTAKGQEADIILGLNLGADDYITKPFRVGELTARANAILRRRGPAPAVCLFGECALDLAACRLTRAGITVDLTAREYALLAFLASRPGRALSRQIILDAVWGNAVFVTDRSIDRCVTTLRAKIEPDPHHPSFVQTIRGIGYRFDPGDPPGEGGEVHPRGGTA